MARVGNWSTTFLTETAYPLTFKVHKITYLTVLCLKKLVILFIGRDGHTPLHSACYQVCNQIVPKHYS